MGKRRERAAGLVPWRCLQQRGIHAVLQHILKNRRDGAGADRFLTEQGECAYQKPMAEVRHLELLEQCRDEGRGPCAVDATGEKNRGFLPHQAGLAGQDPETPLPQRQAGAGTCVTATLAPFQDEATTAFTQLTFEQLRRGAMDDNAFGQITELTDLQGIATGQNDQIRPRSQHLLDLRLQISLRAERQQPDAPGMIPTQISCLMKDSTETIRREHGGCDHRHGPCINNRTGESRTIADTGHRPLHNGQGHTQPAGHRSPTPRRSS